MAITLHEAKRRLRKFADIDAARASPLYEHLAGNAAEDDEVAGLLTAPSDGDEQVGSDGAAAGQRASARLLLAAAHRLVQADPIHPLSRYYPSLGGFDGVDNDTWPVFRTFLLERAEQAREIVATRYTHTNEVARAALLYPAVAMAATQASGTPALVEVGCSAGLLLGMDKYAYRYQCDGGEQLTGGPAKASVGLHCALKLATGAAYPTLPKKLAVGPKLGLDRRPVDATDEEELAWLEACVWADQPDQVRLLRTAATAQRADPPELVAGDLVDDLAQVAGRVPAGQPIVMLTSRTLAQLPQRRRMDFLTALSELATDRPLWWVSHEPYQAGLAPLLPNRDDLADQSGTSICTLGLVRWTGGAAQALALARTDAHGQRMTWL